MDIDDTNAKTASVETDMPRQLGFYNVIEKIGQGGMAIVYRGVQPSLNRSVAIKVLPPQFAATPELLARFEREAATLAQLNHSNIVQVIDRGRKDDMLYIVMELVEGDSLDKIIEKGRMPVSQVIAYATQICDGLDYAHAAGVVHRDLKPSNVLVDKRTGRAKIADFGIATLDANSGVMATLTADRTAIGTMNYMSPEQRMDSHTVTSVTDIFSLGVILYEMLTGKLPVGHFKLPTMVRPDIPLGFDTIIKRCLAESPADRYPRAGEVGQELQRLTVRAPAPRSFSALGRLNKRQQWMALAGIASAILIVLIGAALLVGYVKRTGPADVPVVHSAPPGKEVSSVEAQVQADYARAQGLMSQGKWNEAISILDDQIRQNGQHALAPEFQFAIAKAYEQLGEQERIILEYDRLIRNYPGSVRVPEAIVAKCRTEWQRGRQRRVLGGHVWDAKLQERLVTELNDMLVKHPSGVHAAKGFDLVADIAVQPMLEDMKTAADALMKRYALMPKESADTLYRAAELYARARQRAAAADTYGQFARDFPTDKRAAAALDRAKELTKKTGK